MTHDERIERVRRAMCCPEGCMFEGKPEDCQAKHLVADKVAEAAYRATLEAIREIGGDAHAAGYVEFRKHTNFGVGLAAAHTAMIDHLLNAKPSLEDERIAAMEGK